jgi:hypothetical protein
MMKIKTILRGAGRLSAGFSPAGWPGNEKERSSSFLETLNGSFSSGVREKDHFPAKRVTN